MNFYDFCNYLTQQCGAVTQNGIRQDLFMGGGVFSPHQRAPTFLSLLPPHSRQPSNPTRVCERIFVYLERRKKRVQWLQISFFLFC